MNIVEQALIDGKDFLKEQEDRLLRERAERDERIKEERMQRTRDAISKLKSINPLVFSRLTYEDWQVDKNNDIYYQIPDAGQIYYFPEGVLTYYPDGKRYRGESFYDWKGLSMSITKHVGYKKIGR